MFQYCSHLLHHADIQFAYLLSFSGLGLVLRANYRPTVVILVLLEASSWAYPRETTRHKVGNGHWRQQDLVYERQSSCLFPP